MYAYLPTYFDGEAALDCIVMEYCGFSSFAYIKINNRSTCLIESKQFFR